MKLKKFLSALVSGAMILGTLASVPVFAEDAVATITRSDNSTTAYTSYDGETGVFANVQDGDTVTFHTEKVECARRVFPSVKNVTYTSDYQGGTLMYHGISDLTTMDGTTTFKGLKFDGNAISQYGSPDLSNLDLVIDDCTFNNAGGNCVYITGKINSLTVTNCSFTSPEGGAGGQYLVWPYNATTITIKNNIFTGNGTRGAIHLGNATSTATVSGNTINSFERGVQVALSGGGIVNIKENTFSDIKKDSDSQGRTAPIFVHSATNQTTTKVAVTDNTIANSSVAVFGESGIGCIVTFTGNTVDSEDAGNLADNTATYAAKIGDKGYATFAYALAAAQDGETVTIMDDIVLKSAININKNLTVDVNGKTITAYEDMPICSQYGPAIEVSGKDAKLTIVGSGKISGKLKSDKCHGTISLLLATNGGTINIGQDGDNSGVVEFEHNNIALYACDDATLNIYYGNFTATEGGACVVTYEYGAAENVVANIFDGQFKGEDVENGGSGCAWANGGIVNIYGGKYEAGPLENADVPGEVTGADYCLYDYADALSYGPFTKGLINVCGGSFIGFDPSCNYAGSNFVPSGYIVSEKDNTYTVTKSETKIIDTAKTTGAEIKLDNLHKNDAINHTDDATYKVVVSTAPAADAEKANEAIKANTSDNNKSKAIFDISVVKTDSNGTTKDVSNTITQQQVTLTLGETPATGTTVYVYHVKSDGTYEQVAAVPADGTNKVTFTAPSFSTYAATYTATPIAEANITKNVGVAFERVGDTSEYNIVLKALDSKTINRFMSADLTFDMNVTSGAVAYTVNPAASVNLIDKGNGRYEFNLDGLTSSGATGTEVTIGTVTFEGSGTVKFGVKTEGVTTNIVNTAKLENNIVDNYATTGDGTNTGKLVLNDDVKDGETIIGVINATFTAPTKDLNVNIAYNNAINNNAAAYQDMTVTISGGDLSGAKTVELGTEPVKSGFANAANVTVTYDTVNSAYTIKVANELTQNVSYVVTVSGAGYRTARHTVTMTGDKTLNFWNNVMDDDTYVEAGTGTPSKTNFLAGDIVKDNNINIYDLSAVVSYFGTDNLVTAHPEYARYDLNRDGKIDSKDVAYVLVSWNK